MSSSLAPARGRPRRSTSSSRDQYYPVATGAKRHPDDHDELTDSGSDGGYSDNEGPHRPHSPAEARPRRTRTLMTPQQLTILHALLHQTRFPTTNQREEAARQTGLTPRKVQVWFQNQRQKQNEAARRANAANLPLYSANSGSQWRAGPAAAYQSANANPAGAQYAVPQAQIPANAAFAVGSLMDPVRPSTPNAYIPMGVANNGGHTRRRYDSVTYDSRGAAVASQSRSTTTAPMYGMAPVPMPLNDAPASADTYRLRSLRAPPPPQSSRSDPRYNQEDLRLPPLNLENAGERGRSHSHASRPPVSGTRPSHLRTSTTAANIPPPFTLEPQPMWSNQGMSSPTAATNMSNADPRVRSGSDPLRGFDDLNLSSGQAPLQRHPLAQSASRQHSDGHRRQMSLQANHLAASSASPVARLQQQSGPARSSTPGPYPHGYDQRAVVGVRSPPVADPVSRSATPSPAKKGFWKWGSKS